MNELEMVSKRQLIIAFYVVLILLAMSPSLMVSFYDWGKRQAREEALYQCVGRESETWTPWLYEKDN